MTRTRTLMVVVAAVVAMALGGCVSRPAPTPSSTPTPSLPPTTPTLTVTPTPTFSAVQRPAADAVVRFFDVLNRVASDPTVPLDELHQVATGELVDERLRIYFHYRQVGVSQVGDVIFAVRSVAGDQAPFMVDVCVDIRESDLRDKDGNSVVSPESPPLVLHRVTVERYGDQFRVVADEPVETQC